MEIVRALSVAEIKRVQSLILFGGAITTLAMWTQLEDPINLPKMFVLVLSGASVLGLVLPAFFTLRKLTFKNQKVSLFLIGLLAIGLLVSTLATDVKYTAIFGEYHRNNGALSYLAMLVLMLGSAITFNFKSTGKFFNFFAVTGVIVAVYGTLQAMGLDPVSWVIQYNPIVTTLGNPNFTSGFLGLSGIALFMSILISKNKNLKALYVAGLILDIFVLLKSGSIQGIMGLAIGASVIVVTKFWITNVRHGIIAAITVILLSAPIFLALMNIGPLASKIYQGTLKNRFDYWSAALSMFRDHPIFGVGIDRFGEYALQNQVVQGQITDNAHSIYLQLLATGGLVTFIPYLLLVAFTTFIGISALLKSTDQEKLFISGVLGIWLATIAINLVTVDSLGVGVWFWITGGVLISISSPHLNIKIDVKTKSKTTTEEFPSGYLAAAIFSILALIILIPQVNKSQTLLGLKKTLPGLSSQEYVAKVIDAFDPAESSTQFLIQLADLAFRQGAIVDGLKMVDRINEVDQRSYYGNYYAAIVYETTGKRSEAIKYRERLKEFDPWNNTSLIELIKDYLTVGDKSAAEEIAALIKRNYPGSQSDIDASALLVG
jgi:O-antigen ligase